jgi:hypothetical protein
VRRVQQPANPGVHSVLVIKRRRSSASVREQRVNQQIENEWPTRFPIEAVHFEPMLARAGDLPRGDYAYESVVEREAAKLTGIGRDVKEPRLRS